MDPEVAKAVFDSIDANHDEKIEVKELCELSDKFWFMYTRSRHLRNTSAAETFLQNTI